MRWVRTYNNSLDWNPHAMFWPRLSNQNDECLTISSRNILTISGYDNQFGAVGDISTTLHLACPYFLDTCYRRCIASPFRWYVENAHGPGSCLTPRHYPYCCLRKAELYATLALLDNYPFDLPHGFHGFNVLTRLPDCCCKPQCLPFPDLQFCAHLSLRRQNFIELSSH